MAEDKEPESTDESTPATDDQSDTPEPEALSEGADALDESETVEDDRETTAVTDVDTEGQPDEPTDDDPEPALVGVAARRTTSSKDVAKSGADTDQTTKKAQTARAKSNGKGRATPKQRRAPERQRRTSPLKFASESVGELRKVVYPTTSQLRTYFVVVLVFVLFVIAFVSLLDLGFGWVILKVFG